MPGKVITVAQQKGGAGKTTVAANLAVAWSQAGRRVAVVDIDPQGSLSQWFGLRSAVLDGAAGLDHAQITGWRTQREVETLSRSHDLVVIDSPPHAETEARIAVRASHLVLVPVQPSPMDVWATQPTLDLARLEKKPLVLVLNRVPPRGKLTDALVAQLGALVDPPAVELAETRIGNRVAYASALFEGRAVTEHDRRSSAAQEMGTLAADILWRLDTQGQG